MDTPNKGDASTLVARNGIQAKGFKQRASTESHRQTRLRSWVELQGKRKRKASTRDQSQSQASQ
ncbi:NADP-dependent succinate-semialdehyde dehydrogenase I, partial [Sesbania bispinosa]